MHQLFSRQFEHFRAVYVCGGQRHAAEQIGISQPALSKSLQQLERDLGVDLFERTARGMTPTKAGRMLWLRITRMEREARYAELELGGLVKGTGGRISIGAGLAWSWRQIPIALSQLHREFPKLGIEVTGGITDVLLPMLSNGDLDLMVSDVRDVSVPPEFRVDRVWRTERRPWVRAGHPLTRLPAVTWSNLLAFQWAGYSADYRLENLLSRYFEALDLEPPTIILKSSSLMTVLGVMSNSDLVGILSDDLMLEATQRDLVPLELQLDGWQLEAGVVYRPELATIKPFRRLLAIMHEGPYGICAAGAGSATPGEVP